MGASKNLAYVSQLINCTGWHVYADFLYLHGNYFSSLMPSTFFYKALVINCLKINSRSWCMVEVRISVTKGLQ